MHPKNIHFLHYVVITDLKKKIYDKKSVMFKRRKPLTFLQKMKDFCFPSMGWQRVFKYIKLRVLRFPDGSKKIAAGLAVGVSVSFSPFIGTHMIQAVLISYILRVNIASSLIGTLIGNPWTFPFIWWAAISSGAIIFELFGFSSSVTIPDNIGFTEFWGLVTNEPLRIFLPWTVGGYMIALLSWPILYFFFYNMVRCAKKT